MPQNDHSVSRQSFREDRRQHGSYPEAGLETISPQMNDYTDCGVGGRQHRKRGTDGTFPNLSLLTEVGKGCTIPSGVTPNMLTLNTILQHEGLDPKNVRLIRHQDARAVTNCTPYDLWRAGDGRLETYQRIQKKEKFKAGDHLASFVVTPSGDTLFVGLFHVRGMGIAPQGTIDPVNKEDRTGLHLYEIQRDERLSEYVGHLIIDWGTNYRTWVQHAEANDKPVLEIIKEVKDEAFPGFTRFCCEIDQIETIPLSWQEVLKHVRGVYLLVCNETGRQYVGSAKGEESLWGRFCEYKRTGHGGNVELKRQDLKNFQATVLEVVNSDTQEIEQIEAAWKKKLMSREFGLNKN